MPIYQLLQEYIFPDPNLATPEGLLAVGGGLEPERILLAYKQGIFPWFDEKNPILWWSPDPRLVIYPSELHISKSLKRLISQGKFQVSFDEDFVSVIEACANMKREGQEGTWILKQMQDAYIQLYKMGYAHSIEVREQGKLVGGLYGVSLGAAFFGESMFSVVANASKVAMVHLCQQLESWGFDLLDCQVPTDHLKRMGAVEVPRELFLTQLYQSLERQTRMGSWGRKE